MTDQKEVDSLTEEFMRETSNTVFGSREEICFKLASYVVRSKPPSAGMALDADKATAEIKILFIQHSRLIITERVFTQGLQDTFFKMVKEFLSHLSLPSQAVVWPIAQIIQGTESPERQAEKETWNACLEACKLAVNAPAKVEVRFPSASEIKEVMRQALLKECKCSIPHKKIRIMGDAVYAEFKRLNPTLVEKGE